METKKYILSEMPRQNAFVAPDGYFEDLPTAVLSKCSVSKVRKDSLMMAKSLWWSVAACFGLLLGFWFVVPNTTSSLESSYAQNESIIIENEHLNEYLAQHVFPTIIEDELYASNVDLTHLSENFISENNANEHDEFLEYIDYEDIIDHY